MKYSDIVKLKDSDCMGICNVLDTIEYKWNDKGYIISDLDPNTLAEQQISKNRTYVGYNADALKTVMPNAVKGDMVYYNAIVGVLLGAVRHLQERIIQLENPA